MGEHSLTTRTTCRVGSDTDLLSRVQLQEVLVSLGECAPKSAVDYVTPDDPPALRDSRALPNSPSRIAILMSALLDGRFDALVLDAAALPTRIPSGLTIGAVTRRLTPYDAFISTDDCILDELPEGSVIATDSLRREAQMLHYRNEFRHDLNVVRGRGSVDSVIQKAKSGRIDAVVVAAADIERLNKHEYVVELLTNSVCIPAAGQGALAVLVRSQGERFRDGIQAINHSTSFGLLRAEWAFLEHLGTDNNAPVGVLGSIDGRALELEGMVVCTDGREKVHCIVKGLIGQEEELGRTLASEILDAGGRDILQELHLL